MRLALIGCGAVAAKHAAAVAQDKDARLVWLCDPKESAAADFASAHAPAAARVAADFSQIPLGEVDGLIICSPTAQHQSHVSLALKSGKHVLCEKPLAANSQQIRELIQVRDETRGVLTIGFQRRTEAPYVTVRNLIAERAKELGRLKTIHFFVCERWAQTIEGTWRNDPTLGFGYFGDAGVHQVDSIAFMTGCRPHKVQARGDRRGKNVQIVTDVRAEWRTASDEPVAMTAQFVGDANHWREDIVLCFENADILMRSGKIWLCSNNQCEEIPELASGSTPVADFLRACRRQGESVAPAECGLISALWTESILSSIPEESWRLIPFA
jgi:predicted dehydrogenase